MPREPIQDRCGHFFVQSGVEWFLGANGCNISGCQTIVMMEGGTSRANTCKRI